MPPDLRELTSLQILTYFVAGASSGCSTVEELQNLDLGGKLKLSCLENVTEAQAKAATLGNKEKLRHLYLQLSHPEIFGFQDVIKIKNKTTIFS